MSGMLIPGAGVPGAAQGADLSGEDPGAPTYLEAEEFCILSQKVVTYLPEEEFCTLAQYVGILLDEEEFCTLDQTVIIYEHLPEEEFCTLSQSVISYLPEEEFCILNQRVVPPEEALNLDGQLLILLDGEDITEQVELGMNIAHAEGKAATATFQFYPNLGPISIPALQRRDIEIKQHINGRYEPLFTGKINEPVFDNDNRRMVCNCLDMRDKRIGRENRDQLKLITGGVMNSVVQDADAEGADWVNELMKTAPGSLQYNRAGLPHYAPWTTGVPKYTLYDDDIDYQGLRVTYNTGEQVANSITLKLDYRYFRRRARFQQVTADTGYANSQEYPSGEAYTAREAYLDALQSLSNWTLINHQFRDFPDLSWGSGVYYRSTTRNTTFINGKRVTESNGVNFIYALGITADIVRHISQPVTERYKITIKAPESIDQFDELPGTSLQYAVESVADPDAWEENVPNYSIDSEESGLFDPFDYLNGGSTATEWPPTDLTLSVSGDYIGYTDDQRANVNAALNAAWLIAYKELLDAHRRNYIEFVYFGILPLQVGQAIELDTSVVQGTASVAEFTYVTDEFEPETRIKLAFSYVNSALNVTTNWSIPAAPAIPEQPRGNPGVIEGTVDNGVVEIEAPSVADVYVDEIESTRAASVDVAIPVDQITVFNTVLHSG